MRSEIDLFLSKHTEYLTDCREKYGNVLTAIDLKFLTEEIESFKRMKTYVETLETKVSSLEKLTDTVG